MSDTQTPTPQPVVLVELADGLVVLRFDLTNAPEGFEPFRMPLNGPQARFIASELFAAAADVDPAGNEKFWDGITTDIARSWVLSKELRGARTH